MYILSTVYIYIYTHIYIYIYIVHTHTQMTFVSKVGPHASTLFKLMDLQVPGLKNSAPWQK